MELDLQNNGQIPVTTLAIQLNKSAFGLAPTNQQLAFNPPIQPGASGSYSIGLTVTPNMMVPVAAGAAAPPTVQAAIKNMANNSVFYFAANFILESIFSPDGALDRTAFINTWKR